MMPARPHIFIAASSIALMIVLFIQVNWIFQTAEIKVDIFNEKAKTVLSKIAEELATDKNAIQNLKLSLDSNETRKLDSLFNHYMKLHNIHIDYIYEVIPVQSSSYNVAGLLNNVSVTPQGGYQTCIGEPSEKDNVELKLMFPEKKQFIVAEMRTPFITSVILIIVVMILSWRTILSLQREKVISEHTTDFLNNMTHEFKTPLTNIALAGKLLLREPDTNVNLKSKQYTQIILDENEKLRLQVEQMLNMTALERGEMQLHKEKLDIHQIIEDCIRNLKLQFENSKSTLSFEANAGQYIISGDKFHITNTINNLLDNAIKYSNHLPEILILTYNSHNNLIVSISDKGIGISEKYHKRIFDKYFRVPTADVHNVKGFGLGLSYIKRIVKLHEGIIELSSEKNKGSTFTITFQHV